jgi:tetraacyldisaccharide 4'-kinase
MGQDKGQARWQAIWQSRQGLARALLPVAWLYGLITRVRRWMYAHGVLTVTQVPVPVVVIGNVVVGGAGKTPTVLALVQHLKSRGWQPGVVSRGYGRQGNAPVEVLADTPPDECGDEPALIRQQSGVPVFVARRRADAAHALLTRHPEVDLILCDDGLQHLALHRDLAIAVFDDRGIGNGWLLPAGLLREPWPAASGTRFAPDLVLQQSAKPSSARESGPSLIPCFQAQRVLAPQAVNALGERLPLSALGKTGVTAVAGIARPDVFFNMLKTAGASLQETIALPDHAEGISYSHLLSLHPGPLICTEKDAVKMFDLARKMNPATAARVWAAPLQLQIEPGFFSSIDRQLEPLRPLRSKA